MRKGFKVGYSLTQKSTCALVYNIEESNFISVIGWISPWAAKFAMAEYGDCVGIWQPKGTKQKRKP